ncbi:MAG: hypothetical protein QFX32_04040 [Methanolinea sp.]|nr:hypothetical protein [Methanolinea sp.]
MGDDSRRRDGAPPPIPPSTREKDRRPRSVPLQVALRVARERQRSRSSRRKIFGEDPERYLDTVRMMRDVEGS